MRDSKTAIMAMEEGHLAPIGRRQWVDHLVTVHHHQEEATADVEEAVGEEEEVVVVMDTVRAHTQGAGLRVKVPHGRLILDHHPGLHRDDEAVEAEGEEILLQEEHGAVVEGEEQAEEAQAIVRMEATVHAIAVGVETADRMAGLVGSLHCVVWIAKRHESSCKLQGILCVEYYDFRMDCTNT